MSASLKPPSLRAATDAFLARYEGLKSRLPGNAAPREEAADLLRRFGLPGPRDEAWRYTLLRPITDVTFHAPLTDVAGAADLLAALPAIGGPRVVFVNGRHREDLSTPAATGIVRTGAPSLATLPEPNQNRAVALNTILAEDGVTIHVPAGTDAGTITLASLGTGTAARPVSFHPRHRITLGEGATLTLLDAAIGEGTYLHNPVTTITVAPGATITHLRLVNEAPAAFALATVEAEIAEGGTYDSFTLTLGGRLTRSEIHARLAGPGAIAHLNAARLLAGAQHGDFTTIVRHEAPNCASRQTVKTVLAGRARGVFQGKIEVARDAQKTDGYQMNQALLLSADAEMDSKPQLEIYADDVKCSHGATVGALDAEQLFYLRSRGIPEAEARALLVHAFLAEALEPIAHEPARDALIAAIDRWWEGHIP